MFVGPQDIQGCYRGSPIEKSLGQEADIRAGRLEVVTICKDMDDINTKEILSGYKNQW